MLRRGVLMGALALLGAPLFSRAARSAAPAGALDGPRLDAASGDAEWLIVLCHGSGGDGPNMFRLASHLQPYLPSAAFVSPTGPFPREDFGYRWFPGALGDDPTGMVMRGMEEGLPVFNAFLDAELVRLNLGPERLILIGFSQGSMMVLNGGLRRATPPAAIISFAGLRLAEDGLPDLSNPPPVLLILGARENNPERLQETADALAARGVAVETHMIPGIGHQIDHRGIQFAGEFIQRVAEGNL